MADYPTTIEGVTTDWLSTVLGTTVTAIETTRIGEGIGLMGDIHRVDLTHSGGAPDSVVVKLPAVAPENREQGVNLGMYEAEVRFYADLAERTGAGIPAIHFAEIESGTADFAIVMEDLGHLQMVDQSTGMSVDQARAAVRVLADIHAAWWDDVDGDEVEWVPSMTGPRIEMVNQILPTVHPVFEAGFADRLPDGGIELTREFSGRYLELMQVLAARAPSTLAHQDYRVENMMFGDPAADEVMVIDWQGLGRGPGTYDLAYILGGSMEIADRRTHERALVDAWHARLVERGVAGYSADEAWRDYRYSHLLGGLAVSVFAAGTLDLANDRAVELVATMANRHVTAALDHGGFDMVG